MDGYSSFDFLDWKRGAFRLRISSPHQDRSANERNETMLDRSIDHRDSMKGHLDNVGQAHDVICEKDQSNFNVRHDIFIFSLSFRTFDYIVSSHVRTENGE